MEKTTTALEEIDYICLLLNITDTERNQLFDTYTKMYYDKRSINNDLKKYPVRNMIHHVTLLHHTQFSDIVGVEILNHYIYDLTNEEKKKQYDILITHIGFIDGIVAVKVFLKIPCFNDIPHITVAISNFESPVNSNKITNWEKLDLPIKLTGYLTFFKKRK